MRIHILGICGTFMGGLAVLAKQLGHDVSGSDDNVYPPMSTQLEAQGIKLQQGYKIEHLNNAPDLIIVGNTMSRGKEIIEHILNHNLPYISGPQWLNENVLKKRHVLAISGTHGKTTTTGMLTWILQYAKKSPGFLCGGVPKNFGVSACLGEAPFFVIEADEYDTAFFDKRSKFVHYCPSTLIINNIEFDHADIFPDLAAIQRQFAHLLRLVPGNGLVIYPKNDNNTQDTLKQGCWSPTTTFAGDDLNADWHVRNIKASQDEFEVYHGDNYCGTVAWQLAGMHNINNALAAIAAADHVGISAQESIAALNNFLGIKRRLELIGTTKTKNISIYDDFAHHPTAITTTLQGLRAKVSAAKNTKIIVAIELASNSMKAGVHGENLILALNAADNVFILRPNANANLEGLLEHAKIPMQICGTVDEIVERIAGVVNVGDKVLVMSNKNFGGIQDELLGCL